MKLKASRSFLFAVFDLIVLKTGNVRFFLTCGEQITGGVFNLIVLKTTQSSFTNFVGHKGSYMENDK